MEEYGPIIKYIKGPDNYATDSLSMLPLINSDIIEWKIIKEKLDDSYCVDKYDDNTFPLTYLMINKYQCKYKELVTKQKHAMHYSQW